MADRKLEQLKKVPIFARCTRSELDTLTRNTDDVDLPAGRTLIVQGRPNDTFYILISGDAEVQIDGKPVGRLSAGDIFGEISMLDRGNATATVLTTSPVAAMVMSHAQFRDAVRTNQDIALRVIAVMADRLRKSPDTGIQ